MQRAIEKFRLNIKSVKDLDAIYSLLVRNYPLLEEQASDILRAEIVLAVSALDCFIHDLVKQGIIETYQGIRTPSEQFPNYKIPLQFVKLIENTDNSEDRLSFLEKAITKINSKDSYQAPKGINYALQFINIKNIWQKTSELMAIKAKDIQDELSLIIDRRNKIAHEADYDALTGTKTPIDQQNINDVIQFIEKFCESIYQVAQNTTP
jgi:hypothetical protein